MRLCLVYLSTFFCLHFPSIKRQIKQYEDARTLLSIQLPGFHLSKPTSMPFFQSPMFVFLVFLFVTPYPITGINYFEIQNLAQSWNCMYNTSLMQTLKSRFENKIRLSICC
ncbi:hypothetical protein V6Z11_D09G119000 [Gossypium hirsutum]